MADKDQNAVAGDQVDWDMNVPPEYKEHLTKAMVHLAGLGPHPGKYDGPPRRLATPETEPDEPHEADMQRAAEMADQGVQEQDQIPPAALPPPSGGPVNTPKLPIAPPQEQVPQGPPHAGKKGHGGAGGAKPGGNTPAGIAQQVVAPEEPRTDRF
jgi:hypothetical protein